MCIPCRRGGRGKEKGYKLDEKDIREIVPETNEPKDLSFTAVYGDQFRKVQEESPEQIVKGSSISEEDMQALLRSKEQVLIGRTAKRKLEEEQKRSRAPKTERQPRAERKPKSERAPKPEKPAKEPKEPRAAGKLTAGKAIGRGLLVLLTTVLAIVLALVVIVASIIHGPSDSARDTFAWLHAMGVPMERKPFAMGVRIEHRQETIGMAQYGENYVNLPAADYKLNVRLPDGRSAYTFCMCPGGYVVAAASERGGVCTNGMSYSGRAGENANSALLVTLRPEDVPGEGVLAGMEWQREIERACYAAAGADYSAPAQTVGDFLWGKATVIPGTVTPTYRPNVHWCELHEVLPAALTEVLDAAIPALGKVLHGFDDPNAVLTAPETRSSSPVRILRNAETLQSAVAGLYPCGEGAGYAGGITSAAVDGMRAAEKIIEKYKV